MNFKIENRALNITNYPSVAKHFENMASKGWLIKKVIFESIFIYKRIEAEELDFSISPYEVETIFTKKRKGELKEFQSVCESVGWNYATNSMDLHIYFKEKGSETIDIETDDEEELKTLEKIGRKRVRTMYFVAFALLTLGLSIRTDLRFFGIFTIYMDLIKDGFMQVAAIFLPLYILLSINQTIRINRFINMNKNNIELGKRIEYIESKFYFEKTVNLIGLIVVIGLIVNIVYVGLILKNRGALSFAIVWLIGGTIGTMGRNFIKPAKKDLSFKVVSLIGTIGVAIILIAIFAPSIFRIVENYNDLDVKEYKVLSSDNFEYEEKLLQEASLLVPKSYEYAYLEDKGKYIKTEYSNALTEDIANTLVNMYSKQVKSRSNQYEIDLEYLMEEDKDNLWNLEEVYFLNRGKTKVVIREGKEVFYLEGKDFSDPETIKIVKNRLGL